MLYVGLDYHFTKSTLCVLDANGKKLICRDVPRFRPAELRGRREPQAVHSTAPLCPLPYCFRTLVPSYLMKSSGRCHAGPSPQPVAPPPTRFPGETA